jgi:uncharacterized repeat protein (TIGR01451 family)
VSRSGIRNRSGSGIVLLALVLALGIPAQAQAHYLDVSLSLQAPAAVKNGDSFAYSYTATNPSTQYTATHVVLTDTLPDGLVPAPTPGCTDAAGKITCALANIPKKQGTTPGKVSGTFNVVATKAGVKHNTATVTNDYETNTANNSSSADTDVTPIADLSIQQAASKDPILVGDAFDYVFTIHNSGPDAATGVTVTYNLPTGFRFVSSEDCTEAGGVVTCPVGQVAAGATLTRRISLLAESPGAADSTATVGGSTEDPATANNTAATVASVGENPALPVPITGELAIASPSQGDVFIRTPVETVFRPLEQTEAIPIGSELDTRNGKVTITTTRNRTGTTTQSSKFYDGQFELRQSAGKKPLTTARLSGELEGCTSARSSAALDQAAKKSKKGRSLFGSGAGRFRTSGDSGSATVRGTTWLLEDRCDGSTFIRVDKSHVKPGRPALDVDDFSKPGKRDIQLAVGESYLAH